MRFLASSFTPSWHFIYFLLAILLLTWICRDYPAWRRARLEKIKVIPPEMTLPNSKDATDKDDLLIHHYILAMPIASVYIVVRAILDSIRCIVFWTLWGLEKSAPYIDDWLYDKVTIWLPNKLKELDQWWADRGSVLWQHTQHYTTHCLIPTMIHAVERLFAALTLLGRALHKAWVDMKAAWQAFVEIGEWYKLATDLIENWIAPAVNRVLRLVMIFYKGSIRVGRSVWQDILWITQVILPAALDAIAATRMFLLIKYGVTKGIKITHWMVNKVVVPVFRILRPVAVKVIDAAIIFLQSRSLQRRWNQFRDVLSVRMVWFVLEVFEYAESFVHLSHIVFIHILLPMATWYMNDIHPRVSCAYHRCVSVMVYNVILPTWNKIQSYLTVLYTPVYNLLAVRLGALWSLSQTLAWHGWDLVQKMMGSALQVSLQFLWPVAQIIYSHSTAWLEKQVPTMTHACQLVWHRVTSYDWATLWSKAAHWSTVQGEALFSSLERILTDWIKDQVPQEEESTLKKTD